MKIKLLGLLATLVVGIGGFSPQPAEAASQDECAIWLCLPAGFPNGCGGAYGAFKHRLKKGKSPLPSFSSCAVKSPVNVPGFEDSDPNDFSYIYQPRKFIAEHKVCTRRDWNEKCIAWKTIPAHFERGICHFSKDDILQSRRLCTTVRVIGVFEKGQQIGNRYYWGGGLSNDKLNSYPDYSFGEE